MKCHNCNFAHINERPYKDSQCYCPQCGAHSGIVPVSVALPKNGSIYKWADDAYPICVNYTDNLFVWVSQDGRNTLRAIAIDDWKHNVAHGDLIPF